MRGDHLLTHSSKQMSSLSDLKLMATLTSGDLVRVKDIQDRKEIPSKLPGERDYEKTIHLVHSKMVVLLLPDTKDGIHCQ